MEKPYLQNPFPPPPRRIGATLLFFTVAAVALAGCGYLIWTMVAPDSTPTVSAPMPTGAAQSEIATMAAQVGMFQKSVGRYPTVSEGLDSLVQRPVGLRDEVLWPKLRTNVPRDPWGNAYLYEEVPGDPPTYRIFSTGPNTTDPADDISQTLPAFAVPVATPSPASSPSLKFR